VQITQRCLSAEEVLEAVERRAVDVVLAAFDLHRLGTLALAELESSRTPLVILAPDPAEPRWETLRGIVLPLDADADLVLRALHAAVRGELLAPELGVARQRLGEPSSADATLPLSRSPVRDDQTASSTVIAVASGPGSPGRSTVALNLAAALGAVASTVLVDLDVAGPSVAALLDADPTRNLYMIAHEEPEANWEWDRVIQGEVQPLHRRSPHAVVLCGVPKPDMRTRLSRPFLERLLASLEHRYEFVILDVGTELLGAEGSLHRAALALSQQVLVVCATDVVGLWRARVALELLDTHVQISPSRVALVLNKYDPRHHHARGEIEFALGRPAAAIVPFDHRGVERALAARHPVVLETHSRAARALLDFAERVHGGKVVLPPEPDRAGGRAWFRWAPRRTPRAQATPGAAGDR
jgi:MinD-like ATPase involved in chromosome partitioning or flagellar assembly